MYVTCLCVHLVMPLLAWQNCMMGFGWVELRYFTPSPLSKIRGLEVRYSFVQFYPEHLKLHRYERCGSGSVGANFVELEAAFSNNTLDSKY